jgi:hypothetical protein
MAAVAEVCQTISAVTGVPKATVDHLARRLGEAELLPRGPRGRNAPHFEAIHIARVLVGVMAIANGLDYTSARVAAAVKRIEALSQGGEARVDVYADGDLSDLSDPKTRLTFVPGGSFVETIAFLIRWTRFPTDKDNFGYGDQRISAIGLTFGGGTVYGWIEFGLRATGRVSDVRRVSFGLMGNVLAAGLKQEVRVECDALFRLGDLLGPVQLEPQPELALQEPISDHGSAADNPKAAPAISSQTATPAAVGTGPASADALASQPGGDPVNLADESNQQDSGEKESGQRPPSSSPLGSPSSDPPDQPKDEPPWPDVRFQTLSAR